jgi:hypothetical protein
MKIIEPLLNSRCPGFGPLARKVLTMKLIAARQTPVQIIKAAATGVHPQQCALASIVV